jgi:hypothetical protein
MPKKYVIFDDYVVFGQDSSEESVKDLISCFGCIESVEHYLDIDFPAEGNIFLCDLDNDSPVLVRLDGKVDYLCPVRSRKTGKLLKGPKRVIITAPHESASKWDWVIKFNHS